MNIITNISSLSVKTPMENTTLFNIMWQKSGVFKNLFNNNYFLRNCEKPRIEPYLFPYIVSDVLGNERIARPEVLVVVEIGRRIKAEKTKTKKTNTNNNDYNYDSYCHCCNNYDNNYCDSNIVRVLSMCFSDFKLEIKENIKKNMVSIMTWLSKRTYKLSANTNELVMAYKGEGYGDKNGFIHSKAIRAVLEMFSHKRWSDLCLAVGTRLKRIYDTTCTIISASSLRLGGGIIEKNTLNGLVC